MTWLLITLGLVLPTYQKAAQGRYYTVVRGSAEAGLDYTIGQLNAAFQSGTTSSMDDPTEDGTPVVTPSLPAQATGNNGATVSITVNNVAPPPTSSIYVPQLDPSQPNAIVTSNLWRTITATSSYAGLKKTIEVIVMPNYGASGGGAAGGIPYFQYAAFGVTNVNMSGNAKTDAYDSRLGAYGSGGNINSYGGNVGTNGTTALSGNAIVGGSLVAFSVPQGSKTNVVASASGNAKVMDELVVNGVANGFTSTTGVLPGGNDSVKGLGGTPSIPRIGSRMAPLMASQSNSQVTIAPAPTAPATATDVSSISVSGNYKLIVQEGAPMPAQPLTNLSGNGTVTIPPGDYVMSSLTTSGNAQIIIQSGNTTMTRFFIQGNTGGSSAISISGNGVVNSTSTPAMFQVFYNGSKTTSLSGNGNLYGVVYAPNSPISISGNGNMFGAIFGYSITDSGNGMIHYDQALGSQSYTGGFGLSYTPSEAVTNLQAVSWREF